MLLLGLGLTPSWTHRDALPPDGLYYGPEPESVTAAVRVRLNTATVDFFRARTAYDPTRMGSIRWDGDDWPIPFNSGPDDGEQDIIASAFFWLAGWPEYTTTARDRHGRYAFAGSVQERLDLALVPAVDAYRCWLGHRLKSAGIVVPGRSWDGCSWAVGLSVDVDFVRTRRLGVLARGLAAGRPVAALQALRFQDPRHEALGTLGTVLARHGGTLFMKADASAPEDVAYRLEAPSIRRVLDRMLAQDVEIGLHPSYAAYDHPGRLTAERDRLAAVLGRAPTSVRSHYLRWRDPTTPRLYARSDFHIDSTLGFSRQEGVRHGTCHPFQIFDLDANRALDLWEMPLVVMDTTLLVHRGLDVEDAIARTTDVLEAVRRVGGCAVVLWHNDPGAGSSPDGLRLLDTVLGHTEHRGGALGGLHSLMERWQVTGL